MFSSAFASVFAGRSVVVDGGFSSVFAARFAGVGGWVVPGYIGPMKAQAALVSGAGWMVSGSRLIVGGKVLIGPAGKVFAFGSPENAGRWVANAVRVGQVEENMRGSLDAAALASWAAKKREKLAVIAGRVVAAAAKQGDEAKRAALLAESDYCLSKWG